MIFYARIGDLAKARGCLILNLSLTLISPAQMLDDLVEKQWAQMFAAEWRFVVSDCLYIEGRGSILNGLLCTSMAKILYWQRQEVCIKYEK